eukprot:PhM_4_TR3780/c0_g1_i1/m.50410
MAACIGDVNSCLAELTRDGTVSAVSDKQMSAAPKALPGRDVQRRQPVVVFHIWARASPEEQENLGLVVLYTRKVQECITDSINGRVYGIIVVNGKGITTVATTTTAIVN